MKAQKREDVSELQRRRKRWKRHVEIDNVDEVQDQREKGTYVCNGRGSTGWMGEVQEGNGNGNDNGNDNGTPTYIVTRIAVQPHGDLRDGHGCFLFARLSSPA